MLEFKSKLKQLRKFSLSFPSQTPKKLLARCGASIELTLLEFICSSASWLYGLEFALATLYKLYCLPLRRNWDLSCECQHAHISSTHLYARCGELWMFLVVVWVYLQFILCLTKWIRLDIYLDNQSRIEFTLKEFMIEMGTHYILS